MRLVAGTMMFLLASGLAAADPGPSQVSWVQGEVALVQPDTCDCIKNLAEFGVAVGTWYTPRWGAELDFLEGTLDSRHTSAKADEKQLNGSVLFGLNPAGTRWFPYLSAGLGGARVATPYSLAADATTRLSFHGGIGIQGFLGQHLFTSLEARAVTIETLVTRAEKQAVLGVGLIWGVPAVAPSEPGKPPLEGQPALSSPPLPAPPPPPPPAPAVEPVVVPLQPPPAPVLPPPIPAAPPSPPPALTIVLDDATLHFANNMANLSPEGVEVIRKVGMELKGYSGTYRITVTGHTSSLGGRAHNQALSKRRADAVVRILAATGLGAERMSSVGMGPDQPIADNKTAAGQAKNRRVEIDLKADQVKIRHAEVEAGGLAQ